MVCLVGVDGSDGSRSALRWGHDFAATMGERLCAVRAWEYPSIAMLPGHRALSGADDVDAVAVAELSEFVRDVLGADADHVDVEVERGPAAYALCHAAGRIDADTVVVSRRGLGAIAGRLVGSVSRAVVEHSPCSVIIVPSVPSSARGPILVGLDGSANAAAALHWAVTVAQASGAEIEAVHGFGVHGGGLAGGVVERIQRDAHVMIDRQCQPVVAAGIGLRTVVDSIDPRLLIAQVARSSDARMIVVGARGIGPVEALLMGSVATYLSHHGDRPVAIVR